MKNFQKIANLLLLSTLLFGLFGIINHSATKNISQSTANHPMGDNNNYSLQSANLLGVFSGNEHQQRVNPQLPTCISKHETNNFPDFHLGSVIDNKIFFIKLVYYIRNILVVFHTYDIIYPFHFFP